MTTVYANGRSILHKGHGKTHICAVPDVCKTPSPAGPVPIPYVNLAQDSDLTDGAKNTQIEGNPITLKSSKLSTSSGDEPGTAGGVISSKNKGVLTWTLYSFDVQVEGQGVVRFTDAAMHNGNTFNTAFISQGGTGFAYGDDAKCPICGEGPEKHRVLETEVADANASALIAKLMEKYRAQQAKIDEFMTLREKRITIEQNYNEKIKALTDQKTPLQAERTALIAGDKTNPRLAEVMKQLAALDAQIGPLRAEKTAKVAEVTAQMKAINDGLKGQNVLRMDDKSGTYTQGYMVGALVCKCGAKKLAACSGDKTPGFESAVSDIGFTIVDVFAPSPRQSGAVAAAGRKKWDCAAPKLIQKAEGHKAASISEKWFSPYGDTVTVKYMRAEVPDKFVLTTDTFSSGVTVPSCETCQQLLPEMMCDSDEPCAG